MSCRGSLGLAREHEVVRPVLYVTGQEVERVPEALQGLDRVLAGVGLHALAPAPEDVDLRPQLHAEVDRVHRLLQRVGAHARVIRRERAVLERRIAEQVGGGHRDHQARRDERLLEVVDDAIAVGGGGVDGHQVVVVEVHAVGADLREQVDDVNRRQCRADGIPERIAAAVADGPEPERELVFGPGGVEVTHGCCSFVA
jgi:hypothetical protein